MLVIALVVLIMLGAIALAVLAHLSVSVFNSYTSALPVATPTEVIPEIISALSLEEAGTFIEPGCGDGRVMEAVLESRPSIKATGIDNNPVILAAAYVRLHGQAKLVCGNLARQDFTNTGRVFAYLSPKMMAMLDPVFKSQLQAGARVVSLQFPLPGRTADQEIVLVKGKPHAKKLYIYEY